MIERELSIDGCRIVVWRIDEDEEHLAEKCAVQGISTADVSAIGNCGCRRQKMAVRLAIAHLVDGGFTLRHTDEGAPEIDGIVRFTSDRDLDIGDFVEVEIFDVEDYDLIGEVKI